MTETLKQWKIQKYIAQVVFLHIKLSFIPSLKRTNCYYSTTAPSCVYTNVVGAAKGIFA